MTKIQKLYQIKAIQAVENILVYNQGSKDECYIDSRTIRNEKGMPIVKQIAEIDKYIWYVCPFCQQIHIESKRCLNVNNRILWTNCRYRSRVLQYITIDCDIEPIAHQEATDSELEQEYILMQEFEKL